MQPKAAGGNGLGLITARYGCITTNAVPLYEFKDTNIRKFSFLLCLGKGQGIGREGKGKGKEGKGREGKGRGREEKGKEGKGE